MLSWYLALILYEQISDIELGSRWEKGESWKSLEKLLGLKEK